MTCFYIIDHWSIDVITTIHICMYVLILRYTFSYFTVCNSTSPSSTSSDLFTTCLVWVSIDFTGRLLLLLLPLLLFIPKLRRSSTSYTVFKVPAMKKG